MPSVHVGRVPGLGTMPASALGGAQGPKQSHATATTCNAGAFGSPELFKQDTWRVTEGLACGSAVEILGSDLGGASAKVPLRAAMWAPCHLPQCSGGEAARSSSPVIPKDSTSGGT